MNSAACNGAASEAASPDDVAFAEIVVVRHGETEWNADGRIQVCLFLRSRRDFVAACNVSSILLVFFRCGGHWGLDGINFGMFY